MTELEMGTGPAPGTTTGQEEKRPSMSMNTDGSLTINIGSDDSGTRVRFFEANAIKLDFEECMEGVTEVEAVQYFYIMIYYVMTRALSLGGA